MTQTTIQDLFQEQKSQWIEESRDVARKLLSYREEITIEDVLERNPRPKYLHPNTTGSVFQNKEFKKSGYKASRRRSSHGRTIAKWTLAGVGNDFNTY